jgi:hypothetical protein
MPETAIDMTQADAGLLASGVRIPDHVVFRTFVKETVVLNLETGLYHGLNPSGGRMLEELDRRPTVGEAARVLAEEFGRSQAEIERDLSAFVRSLAERGLIEIREPSGR